MTCTDQYNSFETRRTTVEKKPGEIFTAYKATAAVDKNEGRFGGTETLGVFYSEEAARRAAKGMDVMGSDGRVEPVRAIMSVDGNAYVCGSMIKELGEAEIRERALKKLEGVLDEDEKRVLLGGRR